jgi:hypothetical protein
MDRGIAFFVKHYRAIVCYLREECDDGDPAAAGLLNVIKTPEFVGSMLLLRDVWPRLANMSLAFQVSWQLRRVCGQRCTISFYLYFVCIACVCTYVVLFSHGRVRVVCIYVCSVYACAGVRFFFHSFRLYIRAILHFGPLALPVTRV